MENHEGRLTIEGICPCGGKLTSSEWSTVDQRKGRTTCQSCGRTELNTRPLKTDNQQELI